METPNLVVIPPSPLDAKPASSPSPSYSTVPSTPGLTQSSDDNPRGSSETTIEIYSMYGDDDTHSSWPPNGRPIQDISEVTELAYCSVDHSSRESSMYHTATSKSHRSTSSTAAALRASAISSGSGSSSTDRSSPYIGTEGDEEDNLRSILPPPTPPKHPQRHSGSGASHPHLVGPTSPQTRYLSPSPPHSRPSSTRSHNSSPLNGHTAAIPRSSNVPLSEHASLTSPS